MEREEEKGLLRKAPYGLEWFQRGPVEDPLPRGVDLHLEDRGRHFERGSREIPERGDHRAP